MIANGSPPRQNRVAALWRFALAISILNVLGHTVFGFEQSIAQPLIALATAYSTELLLEWLGARADRRAPQFAGGFRSFVEFPFAAHIKGFAGGMAHFRH